MNAERDQEQTQSQGRPNGTARRWGIGLALIVAAFLVGFVPMWLSSRTLTTELQGARRELRRSQLQKTLGSAVVDARRGEYEAARQASSQFFTEINSEMDNTTGSVLADQEKAQITPALGTRDDIITLLSRSDPASTERLSDLYVQYRGATSAP
ncbi:MAG: hypothetical protein ABI791_00870 [Acidobacteriota bacterium]